MAGRVPPKNLFGMDRSQLEKVCAAFDQRAFRARQIYAWLYDKRVTSVDAMTNLPQALREQLQKHHDVRWPAVAQRRTSADGTIKYLFRLDDGATVESVFIPEPTRRTLCLSSQAGCALRCAFCLTGVGGFRRNLEAGEILGQAAAAMAASDAGGLPWNVVMMGMGEPLLNYDATMTAVRVLMDPKGFAIPPRRLTVSTVGILPALERLADEPVRPNLAISLHAAHPGLRAQLMPIEGRYPLEKVIDVARRYRAPRGGRITFEYVLLKGVNDSPAEARALARLLGRVRAKVNLIPLNPAPEIPFETPEPERVDAFARILVDSRATVSVRRSRGADILAACGQLHLAHNPTRPHSRPSRA